MEIIVGKTSGFCAGVRNAINQTEKELKKEEKNIYCLGELVHNKQVVSKLEEQGLEVIDNFEDIKGKVIIRAHGIEKKIYEEANKRNIELIDLTCPKVLQIHNIAEEYAKKGYFIILIGIEGHPETIGTISFCGKNSYLLKDNKEIEDCVSIIKEKLYNKILIIVQTTYSLKKFEDIVYEIKKQLGTGYMIEVKNTICSATRIRQEETEKISQNVEYMIIVGGKNSSNTKKLYEISKNNCKNVILIETVEDLSINEIMKYSKIGIMAGASTPNNIVEEIKIKIENEKKVEK